ncbi:MAG: XTP/dITP diphosphohydrolase [Clostridiales bacterium]|nr:XTP/dITP diphosphohydrolase [Clostridiales bacterium]
MKIKDIIIASNNRGKIAEIKHILTPLGVNICSMQEKGIYVAVEEDGNSFQENAIKKAMTVCKVANEWTLADDSGLIVQALGGRPGIYSARFAGLNASDEDNRRKLLDMMRDVPWDKRKAFFYCCVALVSPDGYVIMADGRCDGYITYEEMGSDGFGYDPVFLIPEYNKTFAQLDASVKNEMSHRARALDALKDKIKDYV